MANKITVSDHSLIRFMERSCNLAESLENIKQHIIDKIEPTFSVIGDGNYPMDNGLVAVVDNSTVITVKPRKR